MNIKHMKMFLFFVHRAFISALMSSHNVTGLKRCTRHSAGSVYVHTVTTNGVLEASYAQTFLC